MPLVAVAEIRARSVSIRRLNGSARNKSSETAAPIAASKEGTSAPNGKAMKLTRGHAVPLCKGGSNSIINIIPQCLRCDLKQGRNIHPSVVAFSLFDRFIA